MKSATQSATRIGSLVRRCASGAAALAALVVAAQCSGPMANPDTKSAAGIHEPAHSDEARAAWRTVYQVLQHPRCMNCHPAGDAPLQGDDSHVHAQNVQRGPDGKGLFAMRCATCHQTTNLPGALLPPGAPNWNLPRKDEPLIFEGRSSSELCRQLRDPAHNGKRTPEQLYDHMAHDALVGWGWNPGIGRTPVPISREEFARAVRTWIDGGCDCPD
jgi:mono/diheme cytochrome c family protein